MHSLVMNLPQDFSYTCTRMGRGSHTLVGSSADFVEVAVSEPKKMLPKMTLLDVPPSLHLYLIVKSLLAFLTKIPKLWNYLMLDAP